MLDGTQGAPATRQPAAQTRAPAESWCEPGGHAGERNLLITILRLAGAAGIAAALRYHGRRHSRPPSVHLKQLDNRDDW
jgi:hypothetical protein